MSTLTLTAAANQAAQALLVLDSGEGLSTQQKADALVYANQMLALWSIEQRMVPSLLVTQGLALVSGQQKYTLGSGGGWNITRPVAIVSATAVISAAVMAAAFSATGDPKYALGSASQTQAVPLKILTASEWAALPDRELSQVFPVGLFYDRASSTSDGAGTGNVYIGPKPLGGTVELETWQPLAQFADTTTALTLPAPAYAELIVYGLAIRMAPYYGVAVPDLVVKLFTAAESTVATLNAQLIGAAGLQPAAAAPPAGQQ